MAMPLHDEQLFAKYAFARLRDIENSQQRAQLATMEKEASLGRIAKWALGLAGAGTAGYVGSNAYKQYKKNKKRFRMEDTTNWDKPEEFWNTPPVPASDPSPAPAAAPADLPQQRVSFRAPAGVTRVPSDWRLESEGTAYGVPMRRYSAPAPAPASASLMQKGASFDKDAAWLGKLWQAGKTTARGIGADVSTGVTGNWGFGGLLKGIGRMLGAESETVLRQGLNNADVIRRGATVNGKTLDTLKDMGEFMKGQNKNLEEAAKGAGKIFDETAEAWNQTRRYLSPEEMSHLNPGMMQRVGQRLAHWGQKITDLSDAGQSAYRRSLNKNFGERTLGNQIWRKGIGFTSVATPMGYVVASEMAKPDEWWAAPGRWLGTAFEYGSLPGLAGTTAGKVGSAIENTTRTATIEGARMGSQITAGELANVGRRAYLAGLINPDKLSYMVADRANHMIDKQFGRARHV